MSPAPAAPLVPDCTGALVAGGRAARLGGVAKGLLSSGGQPIAARSLALFAELFEASLVVSNDLESYASLGAPVIADAIPGKGAPGGLHAALADARTGWVFAAACDMPFLSPGPIRWLAERRDDDFDAVLVRWHGRLEPLHGFWSRRCLPVLDPMLRAGNPSLRDIARAVRTRIIDEEAWSKVDPGGRSLENANTPEDLARLGLSPPEAG